MSLQSFDEQRDEIIQSLHRNYRHTISEKDQQIKDLTELFESSHKLCTKLGWLLIPITNSDNLEESKKFTELLQSYQQKYPKP